MEWEMGAREREEEKEEEVGKFLFCVASVSAAMNQGCGQWQINVCAKVSSLCLSASLLEDELLGVKWVGLS